jgi:hypothetical protein
MAARKKIKPDPPAPPNAHNYILVKTKEGAYWRRKRGTVKPAKLNTVLSNNAKLTSIVSPLASLIRKKLMPFLERLDTGRFIAGISARLKTEYNETGKLSLVALHEYEVQPRFKLQDLLATGYLPRTEKGEVIIDILPSERPVRRLNKSVTGYYFDAILLYGDLAKPNSLRIDSETSAVFEIGLKTKTNLRLSLVLPAKKVSWAVFLKLSCIEGNEPANHPRHYGMKVVSVGS